MGTNNFLAQTPRSKEAELLGPQGTSGKGPSGRALRWMMPQEESRAAGHTHPVSEVSHHVLTYAFNLASRCATPAAVLFRFQVSLEKTDKVTDGLSCYGKLPQRSESPHKPCSIGKILPSVSFYRFTSPDQKPVTVFVHLYFITSRNEHLNLSS